MDDSRSRSLGTIVIGRLPSLDVDLLLPSVWTGLLLHWRPHSACFKPSTASSSSRSRPPASHVDDQVTQPCPDDATRCRIILLGDGHFRTAKFEVTCRTRNLYKDGQHAMPTSQPLHGGDFFSPCGMMSLAGPLHYTCS